MEKPKNVSLAVNLLWATLAIGVVNAIFAPSGEAHQAPIMAAVIALIALLLVALLIFKISDGRNWARITFLVLFVLGTIPALFGFSAIMHGSAIAAVVFVAQAALEAYTLFLLFTKPGSDWFSRGDAPAGPPSDF